MNVSMWGIVVNVVCGLVRLQQTNHETIKMNATGTCVLPDKPCQRKVVSSSS